MCLVLDMGGPHSAAIARKVRSCEIYCEVLPYDAEIGCIMSRAPRALIVAGGEGNPFREDAPRLSEQIYALGLPMLGLGFGAGVLLRAAGGRAVRSMPGRQTVEVSFGESRLFEGVSDSERFVERLDEAELPDGCRSIARMGDWSVAFEDEERKLWGVQFYPEQNDPDGLKILGNFAASISGCERSWTMEQFIEGEAECIRRAVDDRPVVMAISGGVDSTVCAQLMHRAIGDQLQCVYVDTGFMRSGDNDAVRRAFEKLSGPKLIRIDGRERFLRCIEGTRDSKAKRAAVAQELMRVFEEYARELPDEAHLALGTTYGNLTGCRSNEGRPNPPGFISLIEPLKRLFKDEIQLLGEALEVPEEIMRRQAFPDAGLALRCLGEVTEEKLGTLRAADRIFRDEIEEAGLDRKIRQYFVVLADLPTGDKGGYTLALRAVNWTSGSTAASAYRLPYDLLERVVERIIGEVDRVSRVVYDVTSRSSEIEW